MLDFPRLDNFADFAKRGHKEEIFTHALELCLDFYRSVTDVHHLVRESISITIKKGSEKVQ
jgi:hypothetical protein